MKYAYSYSRISTYMQCPLRFKKIYIEKRPIEQTDIMKVGSCFHSYVELLTKNIVNDKNYDEDIWDKIVSQTGTPYSEQVVADSKELWSIYRQRYHKYLNPDVNIVKVEQKLTIDNNFSKIDWFSKEAFFRAIFDRIDINENQKTLTIIDYKTGWSRKADRFQGQIYIWLLSKTMDLSKYEKINVVFAHVKSAIENYEVNLSDIPIIEQKLFSIISEIESDENFHSKQNKNCQYCDFIAECPYMQYTLAETTKDNDFEIVDHKSAIRAGEMLQMIETWRKKCAEKLKEYHNTTGEPIKLEHGEYKYTPTTKTTIDKVKCFNILNENYSIEEVVDVMKIDTTKLQAKKREKMKELVQDTITEKINEKGSFKFVENK